MSAEAQSWEAVSGARDLPRFAGGSNSIIRISKIGKGPGEVQKTFHDHIEL